MALEEYRRKRDFKVTSEPSGRARRTASRLIYVVQHHFARREHYDFRLELDGVLKSWAVPKEPVPEAGEKRLAVEVEDHPIEYARFEGTIPAGQYGAGQVERWDWGLWEPLGDPREGLRRGKLDFVLAGKRLTGAWTLVRMRVEERGKKNWLLIRRRDGPARTGKPVRSGARMRSPRKAKPKSVRRTKRKSARGKS